MRLFLLLIGVIIHVDGSSQKVDTLLVKQEVQLLLSNKNRVMPFSVSGDIYITTEQFIFHPRPFLKGRPFIKERYEMYNSLIKDVTLPFDSIIYARKDSFLGGLNIKTETTTYLFLMSSTIQSPRKKKLRQTVRLVNEFMNKQ